MTFIGRGFNDFNELKYSARAVPKTISKVGLPKGSRLYTAL